MWKYVGKIKVNQFSNWKWFIVTYGIFSSRKKAHCNRLHFTNDSTSISLNRSQTKFEDFINFPGVKKYLNHDEVIAAAILLDHAEKIKQSDFRFDSLLIYLQDLNGMLTIDIIYEADLIYQTFISTANIPVQRLVFGGESMLKKAVDRTQSPTISQPPSPKSYDIQDIDYETRLEIIQQIGDEPIVLPLPDNPSEEDIEWHLIAIAEHDNWCRKCKLLLKKKQSNWFFHIVISFEWLQFVVV